ncbi:hypothetical protein JCM10908_007090 [Rhodotorula pacifica]|uniref:ribosomal L1 domain-containing protein n=1 Tax=Rhodotorula pacifica TaxID=1495444 RepID=UPI0031726BAD
MSAIATVTSTSSLSQAPPPLWKPASVQPRQLAPLPSRAELPVDRAQADKAVHALLKHAEKAHEKKAKSDLLEAANADGADEKVFLVVGLKQAPKREAHKPVRIAVPHPVMNPKESPVTLFVKDPQRTYKDLLEELKIGFVSRVVGLDKLRTKHKTFEAKRQLLREADLFLVDDRVMVEVGKSIGKMWRDAKKQPIPVALQRKDLKAELERAVASTYMNVTTGTSLSIKLGTTALHSPEELLANLDAVLPHIATRIPNAPSTFSNIQSLHLKTSTSVSLPIYVASLQQRFEATGLSAAQEEEKRAAKEKKEKEKEERQKRAEEKEKRRAERSATKEGKGRLEKKRERTDEDDEEEQVEAAPAADEKSEDAVVEEAKPAKADAPKPKKAKKSAAAAAAPTATAGKKASSKKAKSA